MLEKIDREGCVRSICRWLLGTVMLLGYGAVCLLFERCFGIAVFCCVFLLFDRPRICTVDPNYIHCKREKAIKAINPVAYALVLNLIVSTQNRMRINKMTQRD